MSLPTRYLLTGYLPQQIVADGLVVIESDQAWYYPFMVDGERNPALEWQYQYKNLHGLWRFCATPEHLTDWPERVFRWVAVGVKETSE